MEHNVSIPKDLKVGSKVEYISSKSTEWDAIYWLANRSVINFLSSCNFYLYYTCII